MKFIFPQNYNFNFKLLGIIDYASAIIDLIWAGFIFVIVNLFFNNVEIKIFIFIILVLPIVILSIAGINGENMLNVISYIIKFLFKPKLLLFDKK